MSTTDTPRAMTLEEKRRAVLALRKRRQAAADTIEVVARGDRHVLSHQQESLWLLHQWDPDSPVYNVPIALRLLGPVDVPALEEAMRALVERHESLRTVFGSDAGTPYQRVEPVPRRWPIPVTDLSGLPAPARAERLHALVDAEGQRPIDLSTGPMLRTTLIRLGAEEHVLVLLMHHIVTDGWSAGVFADDLAAGYDAARTGEPVTRPVPRIQPVDYAAWQRARVTGTELAEQLDYWRTRLDGAPVLDFPADRVRPVNPTGAGAMLRHHVDPELAAAVRALSRASRTSLLAVLQAGFASVLARWTGQSDVVVGSVLSGRTRADIEPLLGYFANTVVLRVDAAGEPSFAELVRRCSESVLGALGHQDVPFGMVVDALKPDRVPGRNPLFQVALTLQAAATSNAGFRLPGTRVEAVEVTGTRARFDVGVTVIEQPDEGFEVQVEYSTELFDEARMRRLIRHFERALRLGTADPEASVALLPLLSAEEWASIQAWNPEPLPRNGSGLLHDLVAGWVSETPDAVAVVNDKGEPLSYADLSAAADRVAAGLRASLAVRPGAVVGVLLDRGPELPIAELGVLKAGAAWLPLDPQQPPARWQAQLADAGAVAVVTTSVLGSGLPPGVAQWHLDSAPQGEVEPVSVQVSPDDLAYIIYTSGSTGKPKGVMVSHRAASSFVANARDLFGLKPGDRLLQFANPAFDVSVFDIFAALGSGAAVVTAPREILLDPDQLQSLMERTGVTVTDLPPAVLRLLDPEPLTALRGLFVGLEAFPAELVNRWVSPTREFHNGYGPTEATVACVDYKCPPGGVEQSPPIGRAMSNHRAYVLDDHLQPVPVGVAGELFIAGDGLARGYANRPGLTAERFLPDPFAGDGGRMYRTGDVVRWRADGNLEFLGRRDRQVKIRGLRIELAEVEHALTGCDGVRQAVVTVDKPGTPQAALVGYVVGSAANVREELMRRLPLHMVPAYVIELDALPLTANGKLDHAKLPAPQAVEQERRPPESATEKAVAHIWHELLGTPLDQVSATDSFFDLGGNSLQVVRLRNAVRENLRTDLDAATLFTHPVLRDLAARIDAAGPAGAQPAALPRADRNRPQPLSPQQEGLLFLHEAEPESPVYHLPIVLRLHGELDLPALNRALTGLVTRHEALRTRIVTVDGAPRQIVDPAPDAVALDPRDVPADRVPDWVTEQVMRPFDLAAGPLRPGLARVAADDHVLVLAMHHIATDGWSIGVLARDLAALYRGDTRPAPAVQPVDLAAWQQSAAGRRALDEQLDYWRTRLDGAPALDFPADRPRPVAPTGAGALLEQPLDPAVADAARALARTGGTSLLAVLQAGFAAVLARWTGQSDVVVGSIFSGRTRAETEDLVGLFANTVVLRVSVAGEPSFAELVRRCSESVLGALGHQDVPFGMVVDALKPDRVPGRNPLFQVSLTLQAAGTSGADFTLPGLRTEPVDVPGDQTRFDVGLTVIERPDQGFEVQVEYSTELFDEARMRRLIKHFERALRLGLADPEASVALLPLLSAEEWASIQGWNPDPLPRNGSGLLHDLVAGWVSETPEAVAVVNDKGEPLSYADLSVAADRVAAGLRASLAVRPGAVVGVLLDRGPELPIAELGVLKAGAAWLPLDPQQPPARWQAQLEDAGAVAVVTTSALGAGLPGGIGQWHLDTAPQDEVEPVSARVSPDDLAYIIYTSGSTGKPKGVMISHRAASSFVANARDLFGLKPGDRLLQFANPAFDVSVFDIFAALGSGAAVVTAPRETLLDPDQLQSLMERTGVTVTDLPPAVLRLLDPEPLTALRALFVGLEAFPAELVNRWVSPTREFHNGYGPTEATVACVDYKCPPEGVEQSPPIGRAMSNHRAYVLDDHLQPVPVGVAGELFIAGDGLARGYANRPGLTAERFLPDPFAGDGGRMYRTGDVVRWRADGNLEFLGRRDRQVKIRGLRIELAEVEHALTGCDGVRQAVVTVDKPGTPQAALVGYVVGSAANVREELMRRLPLHMVPAYVIALETLPLTANGKLDHSKLPAPQATGHTFVAPSTETERDLAGIWHDLLGTPLEKIGATDTFFDLGGNSLLVVRLRNAVRERLRTDLDVRRLYAAPTLAGLARQIDAGDPGGEPSDLVVLRPGDGVPLFLIHAVGGSVAPYQTLAAALDTPVLGLEDPALHGAAPATRLGEVADRYAATIRRARPDGPYRLAGWSMGGVLALEVAARLRSAGADVDPVVLIDSSVPAGPEPAEPELLASFARDVAGLGGTETPGPDPAELDALDPATRVEHLLDRLEADAVVPPGIRDELRRRVAVFLANARMLAAHRLSPCPAPVILLSAGDARDTQKAAWSAYATRGLTLHDIAATHHTVLHHPHVNRVAAVLNAPTATTKE